MQDNGTLPLWKYRYTNENPVDLCEKERNNFGLAPMRPTQYLPSCREPSLIVERLEPFVLSRLPSMAVQFMHIRMCKTQNASFALQEAVYGVHR